MSIGQQDYSFMGDAALQQALLFAQRSNDTPKFLGLMSEMNKRKQLRTAAQGQQAGQDTSKPAVTEADKVMAGIANLSSGDHNYANGGIVAFAGGGLSGAFGEFLRSQGIKPADFSRLPSAAQETLRGLYSNATLGPAAPAGAAPTPAAASAPAASAGSGYAAQPSTLGQRGLAALRNTLGGTGMYGGAVGAGGALLSAGAANALSNASNEQLDMLSEAGGGDDTSMGAAIMRQARRNTADRAPSPAPAAAPGTTALADAAAYDPRTATRRSQYVSDTGAGPRPPGPARPAPAPAAAAPTAPAAPASTGITVEATDTPEQLAAKRAALAGADDTGVTAIYKRMAERDAAKQAKIDAETKDKEGILGFKMSPAVREALLRAGIGAMTSKSTTALGGIGEGLAAGAEAYKTGEKLRMSRQDLLDEAADKRALAEIAAKQGNQDRAGQLITQATALKTQAQNWGAKKAEISQKDAELAETRRAHEAANKLGYAGLENALKVANARVAGIGGLSGGKLDLNYLKGAQSTIQAQLDAMKSSGEQYTNPDDYRALASQLEQIKGAMLAHTPLGTMVGTSAGGGKTGNPLVDKYLKQ